MTRNSVKLYENGKKNVSQTVENENLTNIHITFKFK